MKKIDIIEDTAMEKIRNQKLNNDIMHTRQRALETETLIISGALGKLIQSSYLLSNVQDGELSYVETIALLTQLSGATAKGRRSRNEEHSGHRKWRMK